MQPEKTTTTPVNTFVFQQLVGTYVRAGEDPMNGETLQNAHQFYTQFLDLLLSETPEGSRKALKASFAGQCSSTLSCQCESTKVVKESFKTLELPIKNSKLATLQTCIEEMFQPSEMQENQCDRCPTYGSQARDKKIMTKEMSVEEYPEYLTLHLNRDGVSGVKKEKPILLPLLPVDWTRYTANSDDKDRLKYEVIGVVEDRGIR